MKRLLTLLISLMIAAVVCGQEVLKRDLELRKTAPLLNLNGSGAVLQFYNGDVSLTQSSNLLTLSGGNFSLGANSLLGSGSIGATGSRLLKGWFTDLEITNSPTVNGVSIASIYAPLASPTFTGDLTVEYIRPATDGGASLGIYGNGWNNLFMSRGSRIYFDSDTTFGKLYFDYGYGDLHLDAHLDLGENDLFLNGGIGSDDRKVLIGKFRYLTVDSLLPYSIGTPDTVVGYGYFDSLSVNSLAISGNIGGITLNSGTLTLSGGHGLTVTTEGITSVTLPTSGTLVANPMTTVGDLIVGGSAGAPTRLAAGITDVENYSTENYGTTGMGDIVLSTGPTLTTVNITDVIKLTPTASPPAGATEGMIYAGTDHHLYYYNGSTWVSMTD